MDPIGRIENFDTNRSNEKKKKKKKRIDQKLQKDNSKSSENEKIERFAGQSPGDKNGPDSNTLKQPSSVIGRVKERFSASAVHGVANLTKSNAISLQIMWLIALLLSLGLLTFMLYNAITAFLEYSVVTQVQVSYENPATFPTVSVCNLLLFPNATSYVSFATDYWSMSDTDGTDYASDSIAWYVATYVNSTMQKSFGVAFETFIMSCKFDGIACDLQKDFYWWYHAFYGNCFAYNSGKYQALAQSTTSGWDYGLQMELNTGTDNYDKEQDAAQSRGVRIIIPDR